MAKRTKEDAARDAWERAFKDGSKALQKRLRDIHANNPSFQQFLSDTGLNVVKVRNKTALAKAAAAERAKKSLKAYGATKGTKMGGEDGSSQELRDTTVPLSPEQHAKVKAAERVAKPVKEKKPKVKKAPAEKKELSRMDLLKQIASRKKINNPPVTTKQLRTIAAVGGQEHDHGGFDDLAGTDYDFARNIYNEEAIIEGNDEDLRSKSDKELQRLHAFWKTRVEMIPSPRNNIAKEQVAKIKAIFAEKKGKKIREEAELDEAEKHSFLGKILRKHELKKKVDSTFKDIGDAQRRGNHLAASKAFRKHERYANLERPGTWTKVKEEVEQVDEMIPYALSAANYQAELARTKREKLAQLRAKMKQQLDKDSEDTGNPFANFPTQDNMKKEEVESISEKKWDFAARIKRRLIPGTAKHQATMRAAELGDQAKSHAILGKGIGSTTSPRDAMRAKIKAKAANKYRKLAMEAVDTKKLMADRKTIAALKRRLSPTRVSTASPKWQLVKDPMARNAATSMDESLVSRFLNRPKKPIDLKAAAIQRRADAIKHAERTGMKVPKPKKPYKGLTPDMTRQPSHTRSERDANAALGAKK